MNCIQDSLVYSLVDLYRMSESSGYGSTNSSGNSLTPLGTVPIPTSTSPQATLGQSPANNGYTQQQPPSSSAPQPPPQQQHHMRQQHPAHVSIFSIFI